MLPGPGRRTVLGPLRRGRSHTTPAKVLLRQTHGHSSGSALLTPLRYSAPSPAQDPESKVQPRWYRHQRLPNPARNSTWPQRLVTGDKAL